MSFTTVSDAMPSSYSSMLPSQVNAENIVINNAPIRGRKIFFIIYFKCDLCFAFFLVLFLNNFDVFRRPKWYHSS